MFNKFFQNLDNKRILSSNYTIINNKFALQVPKSWQDKTVYTFEGPEEDGIRHNIWVTIENNIDVPNLDQYAQMNINAVKNELQGYQGLKQGQLILQNHHPAYEHIYRWLPMENREVYQRVIYVLHNNTGYILTATFSKKTWKMLGSEIDKILRSFTLADSSIYYIDR